MRHDRSQTLNRTTHFSIYDVPALYLPGSLCQAFSCGGGLKQFERLLCLQYISC
jgi:hypothetical protein